MEALCLVLETSSEAAGAKIFMAPMILVALPSDSTRVLIAASIRLEGAKKSSRPSISTLGADILVDSTILANASETLRAA